MAYKGGVTSCYTNQTKKEMIMKLPAASTKIFEIAILSKQNDAVSFADVLKNLYPTFQFSIKKVKYGYKVMIEAPKVVAEKIALETKTILDPEIKNIWDKLMCEFEPILALFIKKNVEYAANKYDESAELAATDWEYWDCDSAPEFFHRPEYGDKQYHEKMAKRKELWYSDEFKEFRSKIDEYREAGILIREYERQQYIDLHEARAYEIFSNNTSKLTYRMMNASVDVENMKVDLGMTQVSNNIDTVITDGRLRITAKTILAGGYIQCLHTRYLVNVKVVS